MKINPELLSNIATHEYDGLLVKLFTLGGNKFYDFEGNESGTAEIMSGPDKGKWTTVIIKKLIKVGA